MPSGDEDSLQQCRGLVVESTSTQGRRAGLCRYKELAWASEVLGEDESNVTFGDWGCQASFSVWGGS